MIRDVDEGCRYRLGPQPFSVTADQDAQYRACQDGSSAELHEERTNPTRVLHALLLLESGRSTASTYWTDTPKTRPRRSGRPSTAGCGTARFPRGRRRSSPAASGAAGTTARPARVPL